jgi:hypothetical protein
MTFVTWFCERPVQGTVTGSYGVADDQSCLMRTAYRHSNDNVVLPFALAATRGNDAFRFGNYWKRQARTRVGQLM